MRRFSLALALALALAPNNAHAVSFPEEHAELLRTYILTLINESRASEGLPALKPNESIQKIAQGHAEDTVAHFDPETAESREESYLAHTSSDGSSLAARYRETGVETGWKIAENAGYWTRSPYGEPLEASKFGLKMIHTGMMAEIPPNDGHLNTILGEFSDIGIGLALLHEEDSEMNALFLVTDFSLYGLPPTSPRSFPRHEIPTHGGPFLDIPPDHEYATAIAFLKEEKILQGYDDGNFRGEASVNRAELLKMLLDAVDFSPIGREFTQCFSDISNQWFAPYVCVAKRKNWVTGYPDKSFRPETPISRAEAVVLTARVFGLTPGSSPLPYTDIPEDSWYAHAVQSLAQKKLLPFTKRRFLPSELMKRGEVAEMIYRAKAETYLTSP